MKGNRDDVATLKRIIRKTKGQAPMNETDNFDPAFNQERQKDGDNAFGAAVAQKYWPKHKGYQQSFIRATLRLSESELPALLTDPSKSREMARALANFSVGRGDYFRRSSLAIQKFITGLATNRKIRGRFVIEQLHRLATAPLSSREGKNAPVTRVAKALQTQFHIWFLENAPSFERFARTATHTATSRALARFKRKKELGVHLAEMFHEEHKDNPRRAASTLQRYTRPRN